MKRIILTLIIMAGFFTAAQAQSDRRMVRPTERRTERKIERRRIYRRIERRAYRRHHRRTASEIFPTGIQRSQAVLFKAETKSSI